jgi:hypothetical protein
MCVCVCVRARVCVCVCVGVREGKGNICKFHGSLCAGVPQYDRSNATCPQLTRVERMANV